MGHYAVEFGANGRSKPLSVKFVRLLWNVMSRASRHTAILTQTQLLGDLCCISNHSEHRIGHDSVFGCSIVQVFL